MNAVYKNYHQKIQLALFCLKFVVLICVASSKNPPKKSQKLQNSQYKLTYTLLKPKETHNYTFL